jgi:hypothetical protein
LNPERFEGLGVQRIQIEQLQHFRQPMELAL